MSYEISKAAKKVISDEGLLSKLDELTVQEIAQLCNYSKALYTITDFERRPNVSCKSWKPEEQLRVNPETLAVHQNPV
jgi:AraC-like DNA-binding protein